MEPRNITDDIVLCCRYNERSVIVKGKDHTTVVDLPRDGHAASALLTDPKLIAKRSLHTAILTLEEDGDSVPYNVLSGVCVVRADRSPSRQPAYDIVPPKLLRHPDVPISLVRGHKELDDGSGHIFHLDTCEGIPHALTVVIEPENVLVTCDDLNPKLPPRVYSGALNETLTRFRTWRTKPYHAIIPSSGVLISGEQAPKMLDESIRYLEELYERMWEGMMDAHYPWERLRYTIPWCDVWNASTANQLIVERHQANVRDIALDIWRNYSRKKSALIAKS